MRRVSFQSKKASKKNSLTLLFHTHKDSLSLYIHRVSRDGDAAGERERGHTGTNTTHLSVMYLYLATSSVLFFYDGAVN